MGKKDVQSFILENKLQNCEIFNMEKNSVFKYFQ